MRGLTPVDYMVLQIAARPRGPGRGPEGIPPPDEQAAMWRLHAEGRLTAEPCICGQCDDVVPVITPAGREAMRLYEAARSSGGAS